MQRINKILIAAFLLSFVVIINSCDKNTPYKNTIPGGEVHFTGDESQLYSVLVNPAPAYTITVGTTDVADVDRTVTFNVTSPTGAVAGTQYVLSNTTGTLVIPKGQSTASFQVLANYASYSAGRKDELIFSLKEPTTVKLAGFLDTLRLSLRGPCFEGDIVLNDFLGNYTRTNEAFNGSPYGPYPTSISAVQMLTATTGTITVNNIWNSGWSPLTFTLDWTDPANRKATIVPTISIPGSNAGDINAAYDGLTIAATTWPTAGTFSWCNNTLTLNMNLGVTNAAGTGTLGFFNVLYQVKMAR